MARLRSNFQRGSLSANIGSGDTAITATGLSTLPVVASPDYLMLVLDPEAQFGNPEIVKVTAHSSSSSSATVVRAQESTAARSHNSATVWRHVPTITDWAFVKSRRFNVLEYEADATGATESTTAFQNAAADAHTVGGGDVVVPSGTYLANNITWTSKNKITVKGEGQPIIKRQSGLVSPDTTKFASITSCNDLTFTGVVFDGNNIERFGGVNINSCNRVRFDDCYWFDSNLNASWASYDHYGILVQTSADVWVNNSEATDIQLLEADNCENVHAHHNTIRKPAGTAALIFAAVGDGYYAKSYSFTDNVIIDPRKYGIIFEFEATGNDNNIVRDVMVARNQVRHDTVVAAGRSFACFDQATGSGNLWENVSFVDNQVWVDTSAVSFTLEHFFFNFNGTAISTTRNVRVARNSVHTNTTAGGATPSSAAYYFVNPVGFDITDNRLSGTPTNGYYVNAPSSTRFMRNRINGTVTNAFTHGASTPGGNSVWRDNRSVGHTTLWAFPFSGAPAVSDELDIGMPVPTIASAATIVAPPGENVTFKVSGSTGISAVTAVAGQTLTMIFTGAPTVTNSSSLKLAGAANFSATANDSLTLWHDGTNLIEKGRSVN